MTVRVRSSCFVHVALIVTLLAAQGCTAPTAPTPDFTIVDQLIGSGTLATNGRLVTVNYTCYLYDVIAPDNKGLQFDTTIGPTKVPLSFVLGSAAVIKGFDQGIAGMRVGGKRIVIIPPELGYGATGSGGRIPPNAILLFEIELIGVF